MLTGRQAFRGETNTDVLAAVVGKEADLTRVPAKAHRLLQACLQKDPKRRLQAIGDWRLLLEDAPQAARRTNGTNALVVTGVFGLLVVAFMAGRLTSRTPRLRSSVSPSVAASLTMRGLLMAAVQSRTRRPGMANRSGFIPLRPRARNREISV